VSKCDFLKKLSFFFSFFLLRREGWVFVRGNGAGKGRMACMCMWCTVVTRDVRRGGERGRAVCVRECRVVGVEMGLRLMVGEYVGAVSVRVVL